MKKGAQVTEGKAKIIVIPGDEYVYKGTRVFRAPVFYNPASKPNRDFLVVLLGAYVDLVRSGIAFCDPLAGSGVRGIRVAKEVEGVRRVVLSDKNPRSYEQILLNVKLNGLEKIVEVYNEDANALLYKFGGEKLDVVDIDPFGSPAPFLLSALVAAKREGMLCATATDMQVLCGLKPEACYRKYGSRIVKTEYCHELAVRVLIYSAVKLGGIVEKSFRPIFVHSTDHYVRIYGLVDKGAGKVDRLLRNIGYILHCKSCMNRKIIPEPADELCDNCGGKMVKIGPLWLGPLYDDAFVSKALEKAEKLDYLDKEVTKALDRISREARGPPTYYDLSCVAKRLKKSCPPISRVVEELRSMGFFASRTHFKDYAVRTDASISDVERAFLAALHDS